jgi:hypothetical protein
MRRLLPLAALIATPAHADGFTNREIAYQVLNAADAVQTCHIVGRGGHEANPLVSTFIGRTPSCGKVIGFKVASGVLHYLIADHFRDRDPAVAKVFQIGTIVIQGGVVAANMRFVF